MKFGPYSTDENDVMPYTLPDPLLRKDGSRITTAAEWHNSQRAYILSLLKEYEYGEILPRPESMSFRLLNCREDALGGKAKRKEVEICCAMQNGRSFTFRILIYLPVAATGPVPGFLGLNFRGNHTTTLEEDVIATGFKANGDLLETVRGFHHHRCIPEEIVSRGYASITCCYQDIYPDRADGAADSVCRLFFAPEDYGKIGEKHSVIGAWAWGLSRIMDYLECDPEIDHSRIAVHGLSRLGKTALWAGATDTRYKMVISNESGCGGGALHKRKFGENLSQHFQSHLDRDLPCWFVNKAEQFIFREEELPIDQHELIAMIAPRPLAIGTATEDFFADPKGEFLACKAASEVYHLYGSQGLTAEEMPAPDTLCIGDISFHYRTGEHDQTPQDWGYYLTLADKYL